jgi:hypothetical protein
VADIAGFNGSGLIVPPLHTLEMVASFKRGDFRVRPQLDVWTFFDATNQVPRHAVPQSAAGDQQMQVPCGF